MGYQCGPKISKREFISLRDGKPRPLPRISTIVLELEKEFPDMEAGEILKLATVRFGEMIGEDSVIRS